MLTGLLWASTVAHSYAVSTEAFVHLSGSNPTDSSSKPLSISANTARLLLAQRLQLSQYHDLNDADDRVLEILNKYGGSQTSVFAEQEEASGRNQMLIVVEGVEHQDGTFYSNYNPSHRNSHIIRYYHLGADACLIHQQAPSWSSHVSAGTGLSRARQTSQGSIGPHLLNTNS